MTKRTHRLVGIGGTFDLFHKGHRDFLRFALERSEKVLIGLSSDAYSHLRKEHPFESYTKRKENLKAYLRNENALSRVAIAPLDSVYIPKQWDYLPIEAIIVTNDSEKGAEAINTQRAEEGRAVLEIIRVPLDLAEDNLPISSSRIREGSIDREGKLWVKNSWYDQFLSLPQSLRTMLQKPFGEIVDAKTIDFSKEEIEHLAAVGDVTVTILNDRNIVPKLRVVDLMVERVRRFKNLAEMGLKHVNLTYTVQNTPGQLSPRVFLVVKEAFEEIKSGKTVVLHIEGEEDLTVLPILLHAPIGWVVCYGQPHVGTVKVTVTEEAKKKARAIVEEFTIR
ncbi:MAG: pantetheine-phosphate adenylyltransferase [bacterium]|nr:pantetheine-phosphate adenylyltransferase [bacterium]